MAAFPAHETGVAPDGHLVLRAAVSAYLGRYRGQSRLHTESDLRVFLRWCTDHDLDPLAAVRVDVERYLRWLQDVRRYQPSTVSRRLSVVVGFYGVLRVRGKGGKVVLVPLPPAVARAIDRAVDGRTDGPILRNMIGARMDRHAATRRLKHLATSAGVRMPRMHPHMLRHTFVTTMLDAGVSLRDVQIAARHADPRTTMRYDRARKNLDRHPNYILAAYMASGT
jgi:site-specific recombinase XerD